MARFFCDITIQSKDNKTDFRAFLHCYDSEGNYWELRGYGRTVGEAADNAWKKYLLPGDEWKCHGYTVLPEGSSAIPEG